MNGFLARSLTIVANGAGTARCAGTARKARENARETMDAARTARHPPLAGTGQDAHEANHNLHRLRLRIYSFWILAREGHTNNL